MTLTIQELKPLREKLIDIEDPKSLSITEDNTIKVPFGPNKLITLYTAACFALDPNIKNLILVDNNNYIDTSFVPKSIPSNEEWWTVVLNLLTEKFCRSDEHKLIIVTNTNDYANLIVRGQNHQYLQISSSKEKEQGVMISMNYNKISNSGKIIDFHSSLSFNESRELVSLEQECNNVYKKWSNKEGDLSLAELLTLNYEYENGYKESSNKEGDQPLVEILASNYYDIANGIIKDIFAQVGENINF